MIRNIMTCDLEDWYHTSLVNARQERWDQYQQRIISSTNKVLEILSETGTKITFFVLGYVAEKYPELIAEIHKEGHEIASHSYSHKLVYNLTPQQFDADLKKSISILSSICGEQIFGFRAPSWSVSKELDWFFEILAENNISYDSSLFPFKTFLYGDNKNPRFGHVISVSKKRNICEIPPSVGSIFSKRFPFSGGFYLRVLPYRLIKQFINSYNKNQNPVVMYFHPWELDINQPKINLKKRDKFIQYYNISTVEKKLKKILREYHFSPVIQNLNLKLYGDSKRIKEVVG